MASPPLEGQGGVSLHVESTSYSVAPGESITLPMLVHNEASEEGFFELSVQGIPSPWLSVPAPVVRLAPGEQREVYATVQPPAFPHARLGRHPLVIRATKQGAPGEAAEVACTLTVAALEVPGRIGLLLPATEFPVVPGEGVTIPLVLLNQGLEGDIFGLAVDGIPSTWVYAPSATVRMSPGQQQEVSLTIQPPRSLSSGAGRRPFQIQVTSQAAPGQMAQAGCVLTIATFADFHSELQPEHVESGQPTRLTVENRGNIQQAFTLTWQSPEDTLDFEPAPTQELRVAPGEMAMAEVNPRPRRRPLFGAEVSLPFTARVQSAGGETRNHSGEVMARAMVPSWVVPVVLIVILAAACFWALTMLGLGSPEGAPTQPPAATATPGEEQPAPTEAPPTEAPPEEPTQPPPEEPTQPPPEEPTEAPPAEPTDDDSEDAGGPGGPGQICPPIAGGLILAPLLVFGKRSQRKKNRSGRVNVRQ